MHPRAAALVRDLDLKPHPEGGHYREIFRSSRHVQAERGQRSAMTVIHFLLDGGAASRWHAVTSDEAWHLVEGGPLELLVLDVGLTRLDRHVLSAGGAESEPAAVVPAGAWQAARALGPYALLGCTVGPGFEFDDFTMLSDLEAVAAEVRQQWPDHAELI